MIKEKKETTERRSDCPVSCTLDLVGDKWSLLIIRDMMFFGKTTYNEFLDSNEGIATNILNDRLIKLSKIGLITYTGAAKRKKYALTKWGQDLKPILEAIAMFGMKQFERSKEYTQSQLRESKKG